MRPLAAALLLALAAPSPAAEGPLTLDQALDLAARRSGDLALARAELDVARADQAAARSGVLPRLDLTATFGHSFIGRSSEAVSFVNPITGEVIATGEPSDNEAYTASLQLTQTIFDWSVFQDLGSAASSVRGQARTYDERALQLSFDVTSRFYDLVRAERSLRVLEATAVRSEDLAARAEALFGAGRAPRSDVFTARANLQNDRIAAEAQRARVEQARAALGQVLGLDDPTGLAVVAPPSVDAPAPPVGEPPPLEALLAAARARRPGLAADRAFVEAADAAVASARGGYLPTLAAVGSYGRQGSVLAGTGGVYGDATRDYTASAQVVLRWNLFEGGLTRAQVGRAGASRERAVAGQARNEAAVAAEVASARAAVVSLAREVALATDGLDIARQALVLANERFAAGLATQLEIRDANLKLTQAELALVQSRIDHAVAVADLARAVGGVL